MDYHWEHTGSSSSAHYSCTRAMESKYGVKILNYKTLFMNKALVQLNQLMQLCAARTAWSESDQAVRAMRRCNSR